MEKKGSILCALFSYCLLLSRISGNTAAVVPIPIKVGVVADKEDNYGKMVMTCLEMALSDFYATDGHNYTTRLTLIDRDSKGTVVGAAAAALDLIKNVQVQAIIGPMYSTQASFIISLGEKAHVPIITFSASSPSLSMIPTQYFIRATLNDASQVKAIGAIVKKFGWREVVPIYEDSVFGQGIIPYLIDALEEVNAHVPYRSVISPNASDDQIEAELYKLNTTQTRVFVVHVLNPLTSRLFTKANQLGMMSSEYAWIITASIAYELNIMEPTVKESMRGVIGVRPYIKTTTKLEDFKTRFKKRVQQKNSTENQLEPDEFDLWSYDSAFALAMAAEKAKLANPTYITQANNSRNSTDLEAFGVSNAGENLIMALSSTTFEGLAGCFHLVNGQIQAPPFQIINMVGSVARGIGNWTEDKGIVKELRVECPNTDTKSTSQPNLGTIMWPGGISSPNPPKGWMIPTNGKILKVGVPVKPGFENFVHVTWNNDNSTEVEGYCIDIFNAVIDALPYEVPYQYIPYATSEHEMAGTYNDLTQQVAFGNYDVVVGDVTITANRSVYVDFTLPYAQSSISMVVPFKDDKSKTAWAFLMPLTWELWMTSFCSFVFIGLLIWILEHQINEDFRGPFWHQVGMIFWFAFSTMVFAHKERVISNLARFVLIIWFLVVLILTQSYTASLASMLTVQKLTPSVDDVNELIRSRQTVGYETGSYVHGLLKDMKFDESQIKPYRSPKEMEELLSIGSEKGGIAAAFHEERYIKLFLAGYGSKFTMVGPLYRSQGFGFVFPKRSPLVPDVSRAILNITEGTKMEAIERKWMNGTRRKHPDSNSLSTKQRNLGLASFWGLFLIVGIAGITALILYMIMFLRKNWNVLEKSSSMQSKIAELLQIFNEKDSDNHTFKKTMTKERAHANGCGSASPCPNCQITSTPTSRYATYPPSPDLSIHTLHQEDEMQSQAQTTPLQHGELSPEFTGLCRDESTNGIVSDHMKGIEISHLSETDGSTLNNVTIED